MSKMIFVNLPVADLPKSMAFYEALGFTNNPQFTNENAAAMAWSDEIVVMLLTHPFWKTFTSKTIPNAKESAQVLLCVSMDSREAVDAIVSDATAAGGLADADIEDFDERVVFQFGQADHVSPPAERRGGRCAPR